MVLMLLILALGLAEPERASAQPGGPIEVRARVDQASAYVGEPITLVIDVQNSNHAEAPTIPASSDYELSFAGEGDTSQTSIVIINGRREDRSSRSYRFQYQLTPLRTGEIMLPAVTVMVDGVGYTTEPVRITASEPPVASGSRLVITAEKSAAYVGEPIMVTLTWYLDSDSHAPTVSLPVDASVDVLTPSAWQPSSARASPGERLVQLTVNGEQAVGVVGAGKLDGESRTTLTVKRIVIPREAGQVALGPARVVFQVATGKRRPGFFDSPFDDLNTYERRQVASDVVRITAKALPQPAPGNFSGLVGNFTIDVAATPTVLNVGDPFTLSVRVGGPEPLDRVPALDLSRQSGFAGAFKVPSEPSLPNVLPTAAIFSIELRANRGGVKEVPPIEIPYFDVARGEYAVARSKPIPLLVRQTNEVTLEDLPAGAGPAPSATDSGGQGARASDLETPPGIEVGVARRGMASISLSQALTTRMGAAVAVGPLGAYGVALLAGAVRRRRARDPGGVRRRRAYRRAMGRLRRAERSGRVEAEVSAAIRGYAADCLNVAEDGMTSGDALRVFAARSPEVGERAQGLLWACDRAMFASGEVVGAAGAGKAPGRGTVERGDMVTEGRGLLLAAKECELGKGSNVEVAT